MRVLFCNVGWMEFYRGLGRGDAIKGGGSFVETEERGGEVCNFEPHDGFVYGYVQPTGKTIDTKRIAGHDAESIDNVLIVWTAPLNGRFRRVVVGWYRNATVFREFKEFDRVPPVHEENELTGYRFKAKADDAQRLPIDSRTFGIKKGKKGHMGHSNIWYADSEEGKSVVAQVLALMDGRSTPQPNKTRKTDPEHNAKVEKAAVRTVWEHFEGLGYTVESVEADNVGWDLEAELRGVRRCLRIEVKGLSGSGPVVELTPNEYEKFQEEADDYRLAIVTDALSRTPRLMICRFSGELREWVVEMEGKADGRMEVEPRSSARIRVVPASA